MQEQDLQRRSALSAPPVPPHMVTHLATSVHTGAPHRLVGRNFFYFC